MLSGKTSESEEYPEWKALLTEVLAAIAKRLTSIDDYGSFRSVCTSWRSAATFHNFDREFPRAPRLLYFVKEREEETPVLDAAWKREEAPFEVSEETPIHEKIVAKFLDLESNTTKIANFPPQSPYLSCSGWILVSNKIEVSNDTEFSLKHFILGISIKLPLLNTIITKMVLSGSPMESESDFVVMVIWGYDGQLAFCRPGDETWTLMDCWDGVFYDIIYHDRKLYALDSSLSIVECNIHSSNPTKIVQVFTVPPDDFFKKLECGDSVERFLVESFGKFLLVVKYMLEPFRIYEIELKDGSYEEIDDIGDRCLFLGFNSSICVASSSLELKPNCIYYSKHEPYNNCVPLVGVYTLCGDGHFKDFCGVFDFCFPPAVWVVPSI